MSLRSTILSCVTALAAIAIVIAFVGSRERYSVVGSEKNAIFVFDKKTATINYCNNKNCQLVTPQGTTIEAMRVMAGMPAQNMIIQNPRQPQMVGFAQQNGGCPHGCIQDPKMAKKRSGNGSSLQTLNSNIGVGQAPMMRNVNQNAGMQPLMAPVNNAQSPMNNMNQNMGGANVINTNAGVDNSAMVQDTGFVDQGASTNQGQSGEFVDTGMGGNPMTDTGMDQGQNGEFVDTGMGDNPMTDNSGGGGDPMYS